MGSTFARQGKLPGYGCIYRLTTYEFTKYISSMCSEFVKSAELKNTFLPSKSLTQVAYNRTSYPKWKNFKHLV
jgi:hypothetical protein